MPSYRRKRGGSLLTYVTIAVAAALAGMLVNRFELHTSGKESGSDQRPGRGDGRGLAAVSSRAAAEAEGSSDDFVRPAGPEAMRDPPREWDGLDEASDESFPASDPPSTY